MANATLPETETLDIDVGGWPTVSGAHVSLYLRPAAERDCGRPLVYTFGAVGSGTPEAAFHGRELYLGSVPVDCDPDSLSEWLAGQEDTILGIDSEYRGAEINVHGNRVGSWGELDRDEQEALDVQGAVDRGEIACYWDAGDYLSSDSSSVLANIRDGGLDAAVQSEIAAARSNGVLLRDDDVRDYMQSLLDAAEPEEEATDDVTDEQIEALRCEASEHGDLVQVAICDGALGIGVSIEVYESTGSDGYTAGTYGWRVSTDGVMSCDGGFQSREQAEEAGRRCRSEIVTEARAECARVLAEAADQS